MDDPDNSSRKRSFTATGASPENSSGKQLATAPDVTSVEGSPAKHVLIIGVDGMGGAFVERGFHILPCISKLIDEGVSTTRARTVFPSISAPAWAAVLCSQGPVDSGILNNAWTPEPKWTNPAGERGPPKVSMQPDMAYMFCDDMCCKWNLSNDSLGAIPTGIRDEFDNFPFRSVQAAMVFPRGIGPDYTQDVAYLFHSDEYCKWSFTAHTFTGPQKISHGFQNYPFPSVDAVLMFPAGVGPDYTRYAAYMFCGDEYCKWDLKTDSLCQPPRKTSDGFAGYPFCRVDAVLVFPHGMGPSYCQNTAYMFCGDEYCKWNLENDTLQQAPRQIAHGFRGLPFGRLDGTLITPPVCADLSQEEDITHDLFELFPGCSGGEPNAMPSITGRGHVPESIWKVAKSAWLQLGVEGRSLCVLGWDWIRHLCSDCDNLCRGNGDNQSVTAMADIISQGNPPQLMFIQLDDVDHAGHAHGWGSDRYCAAMHKADSQIGVLLHALDRAGIADETLVLVAADHGGVGCNHGGFTQAELFVPFIVRGGGALKGLRLPEYLGVSLLDVAPTALHALGIAPGRDMRGRVIQEIWTGIASESTDLVAFDEIPLCQEICQLSFNPRAKCSCGKC